MQDKHAMDTKFADFIAAVQASGLEEPTSTAAHSSAVSPAMWDEIQDEQSKQAK
ncbi:hypothetical protein [Nonomuraea sp. NPDC050786]|uniref:hypothetical protein n=1 Tax=Nonomuraea sp. NPDC050786 TaxID=3154840 RepID=UPI003409F10F